MTLLLVVVLLHYCGEKVQWINTLITFSDRTWCSMGPRDPSTTHCRGLTCWLVCIMSCFPTWRKIVGGSAPQLPATAPSAQVTVCKQIRGGRWQWWCLWGGNVSAVAVSGCWPRSPPPAAGPGRHHFIIPLSSLNPQRYFYLSSHTAPFQKLPVILNCHSFVCCMLGVWHYSFSMWLWLQE